MPFDSIFDPAPARNEPQHVMLYGILQKLASMETLIEERQRVGGNGSVIVARLQRLEDDKQRRDRSLNRLWSFALGLLLLVLGGIGANVVMTWTQVQSLTWQVQQLRDAAAPPTRPLPSRPMPSE